MKKLKIPWVQFVEAGIQKIEAEMNLSLNAPVFMKERGYDGPFEVYDVPEYVEVEIVGK